MEQISARRMMVVDKKDANQKSPKDRLAGRNRVTIDRHQSKVKHRSTKIQNRRRLIGDAAWRESMRSDDFLNRNICGSSDEQKFAGIEQGPNDVPETDRIRPTSRQLQRDDAAIGRRWRTSQDGSKDPVNPLA